MNNTDKQSEDKTFQIITIAVIVGVVVYLYYSKSEGFNELVAPAPQDIVSPRLVYNNNYNKEPIASYAPIPREEEESPLVDFAQDTLSRAVNNRPNDIYKHQTGNTADNHTVDLMNDINPDRNIDDVACNLSNSLSPEDISLIQNYKKQNYDMYKHQVECKNYNHGKITGCGKSCYAGGKTPMKCKPDDDECIYSYGALNNGPDYMALNQLALEKNNRRACVTCTSDGMTSRADGVQSILDQVSQMDNVNQSFMRSNVEQREGFHAMSDNSDHPMNINMNISQELRDKNTEQRRKKKVTFKNINNYANFNDYIAQNGVMETSVDKMAEIRTNPTNTTCGLLEYGQNISQVYDRLLSTPYMDYKKSCNIEKVHGILEDI
ncbi:MAG: hypothetical protein Gaeavirus10_7 [Gaeavirus sp.]|uniref:Uncharacterized protein n=1 Tax=Gaeavirus sp. TaxID=2487767 RepID=A0A3G5A1P6_9VIRU|nr:MAG: hypothetical protein Gaeavirus10_7 [Gaeavirus sp.]